MSQQTQFYELCISGQLDKLKKLDYTQIDIHAPSPYGYEIAFCEVCVEGHLNVLKYLIWLGENGHGKIDIHYRHDIAFHWACGNGNLDIAEYLIWLGEEKDYGHINIHSRTECSFIWACEKGLLNITKYLIRLGENGYGRVNIHARNDEAMQLACKNGQYHMVQYLFWLGKNGYGRFHMNSTVQMFYKTTMHIKRILLKQFPDYEWIQTSMYKIYKRKLNKVITSFVIIHQYLSELESEIKEPLVIEIIKEYLLD